MNPISIHQITSGTRPPTFKSRGYQPGRKNLPLLLELTILLPANLPLLSFGLFGWLGTDYVFHSASSSCAYPCYAEGITYFFLMVIGKIFFGLVVLSGCLFDLILRNKFKDFPSPIRFTYAIAIWAAITIFALPVIYRSNPSFKEFSDSINYQYFSSPAEQFQKDLASYNRQHLLSYIQHKQDHSHDISLLEKAASQADYGMVKKLIESGTDIHKKTPHQRNALSFAINATQFPEENMLKISLYLIDQGIDVKVPGAGDCETLLSSAVNSNQPELVERLISKGLDVNQAANDIDWGPRYTSCQKYARPPLIAAISRDPKIVKMLLKNGANPNIEYSPSRQTPLLYVVQEASDQASKNPQYQNTFLTLKLLLDYGANIHAVDEAMKLSPLDFARGARGYSKAYKLLKQYDKKH